jgi:hypothetical protein
VIRSEGDPVYVQIFGRRRETASVSCFVRDRDGQHVRRRVSEQEMLANADLIVGAVNAHTDLVDALRECVSALDAFLQGEIDHPLLETIERARAALRRAGRR